MIIKHFLNLHRETVRGPHAESFFLIKLKLPTNNKKEHISDIDVSSS